ncbi:MAG: hypothetical protein K6G50_12100 [bacterium]|nr:hypothetical protein [bacterium]
MKISHLFISAFCILLPATLPLSAKDGVRYPDNLAWRLITEDEVQNLTSCPEPLRNEKTSADPLFSTPAMPWSEVAPAPETKNLTLEAPKTWTAAPFPSIAPPLSKDIPDDIRAKLLEREARLEAAKTPAAFGEISADLSEKPSAALKPVANSMSAQFFAPEEELPKPFSLRRYYTKEHGFFQVACYCGTNGINAEIDYKTLLAASPNRRKINGFGDAAFFSIVTLPDQNADQEKDNLFFEDIKPEGTVRFDLIDEGYIKAKNAPSFKNIPVENEVPENLTEAFLQKSEDFDIPYDSLLKSHNSQGNSPKPAQKESDQGQEPQPDSQDNKPVFTAANPDVSENPFAQEASFTDNGIMVLIVLYREKSIVLEVAMDSKMGSAQSFLQTAVLINGRLLTRWNPQ